MSRAKSGVVCARAISNMKSETAGKPIRVPRVGLPEGNCILVRTTLYQRKTTREGNLSMPAKEELLRYTLIASFALIGSMLQAAPIGTYVFTGTATGSLGNAQFVDAPLTVTAIADVAAIGMSPSFSFNEL